jgi:hypothetical protein
MAPASFMQPSPSEPHRALDPSGSTSYAPGTPMSSSDASDASGAGTQAGMHDPYAMPLGDLDAGRTPAHGRVPRARGSRATSNDADVDERDFDSTSDAARRKKKDYAKNFRDTEKQHFEELRRRLFPRDPHARRAECLEKGTLAP